MTEAQDFRRFAAVAAVRFPEADRQDRAAWAVARMLSVSLRRGIRRAKASTIAGAPRLSEITYISI
jgi:hypothetical protein